MEEGMVQAKANIQPVIIQLEQQLPAPLRRIGNGRVHKYFLEDG
ncbi:hypothetical protein [Paenibacillus sophorae]|nr:hypothetical protein [Paenibacillus sophorae]